MTETLYTQLHFKTIFRSISQKPKNFLHFAFRTYLQQYLQLFVQCSLCAHYFNTPKKIASILVTFYRIWIILYINKLRYGVSFFSLGNVFPRQGAKALGLIPITPPSIYFLFFLSTGPYSRLILLRLLSSLVTCSHSLLVTWFNCSQYLLLPQVLSMNTFSIKFTS